MTALKEYSRLETTGLWRPAPDAQRREVGVAFGDATLVIMDGAGRPLTHWSLPAVTRTNPGALPALYSPDADATETLEIDDDLMITAIERIRASVARRHPRSGRLRQSVIAGTLAFVLGIGIFWLPGALTRQSLSIVPPSKRSEIGATLLGHVQRVTGATCRGTVGTQALAELGARLFGPDAAIQIVVVPGELANGLDLPGGIIVLDRAMVEDASEPAVVAGHVLSVIAERTDTDTLAPVLDTAGLFATLRLLTSGDLPPETLRTHADALLASPVALPPLATAVAVFDRAAVPVTPWARTVDPQGDAVAPLIAADPMQGRPAALILTDDAWVALQGICRT